MRECVCVCVCVSVSTLPGQAASVVAGVLRVFYSDAANDVVLVNMSYFSLEVNRFPIVSQFHRIVSTVTGVPHKLSH